MKCLRIYFKLHKYLTLVHMSTSPRKMVCAGTRAHAQSGLGVVEDVAVAHTGCPGKRTAEL